MIIYNITIYLLINSENQFEVAFRKLEWGLVFCILLKNLVKHSDLGYQ